MPVSHKVAVIVPAWSSHATIERCLEALEAQTFRDFETLIVDVGTGPETSELVRQRFPGVTCLQAPAGSSALAARDEGARRTNAAILVFTNPDAYPRAEWLEQMVRAHDETGEAIVGAVECFGRRWADRAIHLCRFSTWLPSGTRREVDLASTSALLLRRSDYEAAGGFAGDPVLGAVELSHALRARGRGLIFEPRAIVEQQQSQSASAFIRERRIRGTHYGRLRAKQRGNDRFELLGWLLVTAFPIRFVLAATLVFEQCRHAGRLGDLLITSPLVATGLAASLAGEAVAYAQLLAARRS